MRDVPARKSGVVVFERRTTTPVFYRGWMLAGALTGVAIGIGVGVWRGVALPVAHSALSAIANFSSAPADVDGVPGQQLRVMSDDRRAHLEKLREEAAALKAENAAKLRARRAVGTYANTLVPGNQERLAAMADLVAGIPGGAIIMDVKGSRVYFETDAPLAHQFKLVEPRYNLSEVIAYLKGRGIYTMARFIAVKDDGLAKADASTQIRNPVTGVSMGEEWVDPGNATMLEYNKQVLEDLIASGIDEINFDYIRFPTEYGLDQVGLSVEEKTQRVEGFLKMARILVDEAGLGTKLGISTYAILGWDFDANMPYLGQDFIRFAPLVDIISPMAYPASFGESYKAANGQSRMYTLVHRTLRGYAKLLGPEQAVKLRPWIQGYSVDAQDMREQMRAVYDAGSCGFTIWNPGSRFGPFAEVVAGWKPPAFCPSVE